MEGAGLQYHEPVETFWAGMAPLGNASQARPQLLHTLMRCRVSSCRPPPPPP